MRREPDDLDQFAHARLDTVPTMHEQRLGEQRAHAAARVERRVRVLEDHLHPGADRSERAVAEPRDVASFEADRAAVDVVQPEQRPPKGRLAAAGLAHNAEGLAGAERDRDVVERAKAPPPTERTAAADAVRLGKAFGLKERRHQDTSAARPSRGSTQATSASSTGASDGRTAQASCRHGQRGA